MADCASRPAPQIGTASQTTRSSNQRVAASNSTAKRDLATLIEQRTGIKVSPDSLFDIQINACTEYAGDNTRNVLRYILTSLLAPQTRSGRPTPPRTFIFGAKAAPSYASAKLIIELINSVAAVVNHDPVVRGIGLKAVFFPDYNVKNAQHIFPAADSSEQISPPARKLPARGNYEVRHERALTIGTAPTARMPRSREEVSGKTFPLRPDRRTGGSVADDQLSPHHYYRAERRLAGGARLHRQQARWRMATRISSPSACG